MAAMVDTRITLGPMAPPAVVVVWRHVHASAGSIGGADAGKLAVSRKQVIGKDKLTLTPVGSVSRRE